MLLSSTAEQYNWAVLLGNTAVLEQVAEGTLQKTETANHERRSHGQSKDHFSRGREGTLSHERLEVA